MQQIFISYSRKEEDIVHQLANVLTDADISVWLDVWHIATGENWRDAIQRGLDESTLMLLVITPNAMDSKQVANEWHYYLDEGKPIIPILLEPARIHYQIRSLNYIDFHGQEFDTAFQLLLKSIAEKADDETLNPQEMAVLEMLQSAYKNWLNFERADDLLLDNRQIERISGTMSGFPITDSLWRYLLTSIAYSQYEVEADSRLIQSLQALDKEAQAMIIEPLLVHPDAKVRGNIVSLISLAGLTNCADALQQCLPGETDEDTIVLMVRTLHRLKVDLPQNTLQTTFDRLTKWYARSQLLGMMKTDTKNLLFITDGTELADDFRLMWQDIDFNIVDISPQDMLMMPFTWKKLDVDIFKPYHLIFIIKGEHFSTINFENFYNGLARYIHGGGALFATSWVAWESQNDATLASILPFEYQKFQENVTLNCIPTEEGIAEGLFADNFTILSSNEQLNSFEDTHILLQDSKRNPLFGYRYIGEGRTFYLNSCQHSCTDPFEAQTRSSKAFREAFERVFKWVYESV